MAVKHSAALLKSIDLGLNRREVSDLHMWELQVPALPEGAARVPVV